MNYRKIIELAAAVVLSLLSAVTLYVVFQGENVAEYVKDSAGIKLGGPAALFFIVLAVSLQYLSRSAADKLADLKKNLTGTWKVTAKSSGKNNAVSDCDIALHGEELDISGGQFMSNGIQLGSWSVDHLLLTKNKLIYLYKLKETGGTGKYWKGIVDLNIAGKSGSVTIAGSWEVIGPEYKSGTITYEKR